MSKVNSILHLHNVERRPRSLPSLRPLLLLYIASMYGVEYVSYYVEYIQLGILQRLCTLPSDPSTFLCFFCVSFFFPFSFPLPPRSPHSPSHNPPHSHGHLHTHLYNGWAEKERRNNNYIKKKKGKTKESLKKKKNKNLSKM